MIGVPLQGGKTLQVTFRSLNTRVDFFKSQGSAAPNTNNDNRLTSIEPFVSASKDAVGLDRMEPPISSSRMVHPDSQRHEQFLKKAVQQGVMRGLT